MTSRDVVNRVQRLIRPIKLGHSGTLDPLASGVLLIPIGRAVRLVEYMHELTKEYIGEFQLGVTNDSADTDLPTQPVSNASLFTRDDLLTSLERFRGPISQRPPMYSAVKINGRRAYDLVRAGQRPEMPERTVTIHQLELLDFSHTKIRLRVRCSSGTYIRSLGRDIARSLGSDAVMSQLTRTKIGEYSLENAVELDSLQSIEDVSKSIQSPAAAIAHIPRVELAAEQIDRLGDGKLIELPQLNAADTKNSETETRDLVSDSILLAGFDSDDRLVSLIKPSGQQWKAAKNLFSNNERRPSR